MSVKITYITVQSPSIGKNLAGTNTEFVHSEEKALSFYIQLPDGTSIETLRERVRAKKGNYERLACSVARSPSGKAILTLKGARIDHLVDAVVKELYNTNFLPHVISLVVQLPLQLIGIRPRVYLPEATARRFHGHLVLRIIEELTAP